MNKPRPQDPHSSSSRKRSLRLAIIGAGRLGTALGIGLNTVGVEVVAAVCRRRTNARTAARLIGENILPLGANQLSELPPFDVALIATPDHAITSAATDLAATACATGQIVLHVSGSLPSTILRPVLPRGISVGSMHPLIAISDPRVGATGLRSAFFCIEGERRALTVARQLVATFGAKVVRIETYRKALYHASAVMAAGHAVALFDLATRMLERCGPDRKVATETLASLFRSATNDLGQRPPPEIMTGPFARGDVATVESHLAILGKEQIPDALAAYIALGTHAIGLAEANGLEREVGLRLRAVLDSSSGSHQ